MFDAVISKSVALSKSEEDDCCGSQDNIGLLQDETEGQLIHLLSG